MDKKIKKTQDKSFLSQVQLKEKYFPSLVKSETMDSLKSDYKQIGTVLANQAIEELMARS